MREPVDQGLRSQVWDRNQLDQLGQSLGVIDFTSILHSAMRGEHAFALSFKDAATRSLRLGAGLGHDQPLWRHVAPRGWALRGFGVVSETYQQCNVGLDANNKALGLQVESWGDLWEGLSKAPLTA